MVIICCTLLTYHILTSSPLPVLRVPSIDYFQHRVFTSTYSLIKKVLNSTFSLFSPTMSPSYVPPHLRKSATTPQTPIKTVRWRDHVQAVSPTNQHEPAPEQVSNKVSAFVTPSAKYNKDRQNPGQIKSTQSSSINPRPSCHANTTHTHSQLKPLSSARTSP